MEDLFGNHNFNEIISAITKAARILDDIIIKKKLSSMITHNDPDECIVESILLVNINYSFIKIVKDHIKKHLCRNE